jgi:hypothetical protein
MGNKAFKIPESAVSGFMLLEVLVSVMVMTVGLMAVLGAFSTSTKIIKTSQKYQLALTLAEQKMFEIMNTPEEDRRDSGRGDFGDKYPDIKWDYDIKEESSEFLIDDSSILQDPEKYEVITLKVSYQEKGQTITPITLVTYETSRLTYVD